MSILQNNNEQIYHGLASYYKLTKNHAAYTI